VFFFFFMVKFFCFVPNNAQSLKRGKR